MRRRSGWDSFKEQIDALGSYVSDNRSSAAITRLVDNRPMCRLLATLVDAKPCENLASFGLRSSARLQQVTGFASPSPQLNFTNLDGFTKISEIGRVGSAWANGVLQPGSIRRAKGHRTLAFFPPL
jgi:hypothetical protein